MQIIISLQEIHGDRLGEGQQQPELNSKYHWELFWTT